MSVLSPAPALAGAQGSWSSHICNQRRYKLYIPRAYQPDSPLPLLLLLHGCRQNPDEFAASTRMNSYADLHGYIVAYPEQTRLDNPRRCWNWYQPAHQRRDQGEPAALVAIVRRIQQTRSIDARRIYVAGLSAGGAMASILGATYPDVFAAVGVCSGMPYQAASTVPGALRAMRRGSLRRSATPLQAVHTEMGTYRRRVPIVIIHGTDDSVVDAVNAQHLTLQWLHANGTGGGTVTDLHGESHAYPAEAQQRAYTRRTYRDSNGLPVVQSYLIEGLDHAWPGGAPKLAFSDPLGPNASALLLDFYAQHVPPPPVRRRSVPATPARPPVSQRPVSAAEAPKSPWQRAGHAWQRTSGTARRLWSSARWLYTRLRQRNQR